MFFQTVLVFSAFVVTDVVYAQFFRERPKPVALNYECTDPEGGGNPRDSPILLLHGLTASLRNWDGIRELIANHTQRRVCAVDLRNHGDSPFNNRTDIAAMTSDIGYFLNQQNIRKVNILGHSLGGKIAVHYTLNNPLRVNSLIVEDMRPNGITDKALFEVRTIVRLWKEAVESVPEGVSEDEARETIFNYLSDSLQEMGEDPLDESYKRNIELRLVDGRWRAKWNVDLFNERLKDIDSFLTPSRGLYLKQTLFICGTISPFAVCEDGRSIRRLFPLAQIHPVEGAGHLIHGVFPEFNEVVLSFYDRVLS